MNVQKWDLSRLDSGDLSALRRAAGTTGSDMAALRAFYRACGHCDPRLEAYWYPAVCMDALGRGTDSPEVKPMEECLRLLLVQNPDTTEFIDNDSDHCFNLLNRLFAGGEYADVIGMGRFIDPVMVDVHDLHALN